MGGHSAWKRCSAVAVSHVLKLITQVVSFKRNTSRWKGKDVPQSKAVLGAK